MSGSGNARGTFQAGDTGFSARVTPRLLEVLRAAAAIAKERVGEEVIGTEHVLRALLDDPNAIATQTIAQHHGVDAIRAGLDQVMVRGIQKALVNHADGRPCAPWRSRPSG